MSNVSEAIINHLYAVDKHHHVGIWNGTSWTPLKLPWDVLQLTTAPNGQQWCVGTEYNVGIIDSGDSPSIQNQGDMGGWSILCLAFHPNGDIWCVGKENNLGKWDADRWVEQANNWNLRFIAFNGNGDMWCVGKKNNLGKWEGTGWQDQGGGWDLKSIMFDGNGEMWGVGTDGNVGKWNGSSWDDQGYIGGWHFKSLDFHVRLSLDKLKFDEQKAVISKVQKNDLQVTAEYDNPSTNKLVETVDKSITVTDTETWSKMTSATLGVTESTEVGLADPELPFITAKETVGFQTASTSSMTTGRTSSTTTTLRFSTEIEVPANSSSIVTIEVEQGNLSIPYTGKINYKGVTHQVSGNYTKTNVFNQKTTSKNVPIKE